MNKLIVHTFFRLLKPPQWLDSRIETCNAVKICSDCCLPGILMTPPIMLKRILEHNVYIVRYNGMYFRVWIVKQIINQVILFNGLVTVSFWRLVNENILPRAGRWFWTKVSLAPPAMMHLAPPPLSLGQVWVLGALVGPGGAAVVVGVVGGVGTRRSCRTSTSATISASSTPTTSTPSSPSSICRCAR